MVLCYSSDRKLIRKICAAFWIIWDSIPLTSSILIPKLALIKWNHLNPIMHTVSWAPPAKRECKKHRECQEQNRPISFHTLLDSETTKDTWLIKDTSEDHTCRVSSESQRNLVHAFAVSAAFEPHSLRECTDGGGWGGSSYLKIPNLNFWYNYRVFFFPLTASRWLENEIIKNNKAFHTLKVKVVLCQNILSRGVTKFPQTWGEDVGKCLYPSSSLLLVSLQGACAHLQKLMFHFWLK